MAPKKMYQYPSWCPDPDHTNETVNIALITEHMLNVIKTKLTSSFAERSPLAIGAKGWSAPFDTDSGFTALKQESAYQCAINVFILSLSGSYDNSINWRNVIYLANHYFKLKSAMTEGAAFSLGHFPHCLHAVVRDPEEIKTPWAWGVFDKFVGTEIMSAFCLTLTIHIERSASSLSVKALEPFINCALTVQCKFHVHTHRIETIKQQMQSTHNVGADFKALGFSTLQEAESIIAIIEELQLTKPPGDDKKSVTRRSKCISTLRERTLSQLTFPRLARQMAPPSVVMRKARKIRRLRNA